MGLLNSVFTEESTSLIDLEYHKQELLWIKTGQNSTYIIESEYDIITILCNYYLLSLLLLFFYIFVLTIKPHSIQKLLFYILGEN